jgi:hypothetical protein
MINRYEDLRTSDIDFHFISTYSASKELISKVNPDRCLVRYGVLECVVRCAIDKYCKQTHKAESKSQAMEMMGKEHLVPYLHNLDYVVILIRFTFFIN